MKMNTVTITSSHGHCVAVSPTGEVIETCLSDSFGAKPVFFNFTEWRKRYPGEEPEGDIDILDLGYIDSDGDYSEPGESWRLEREREWGMKQYTVILMYPDYMSSDGPEYYVYPVFGAANRKHAICCARRAVYDTHHTAMDDPSDLAVVGVIEGHHKVYGE